MSDSSPSLSGSPKSLDEHTLSFSSDWHSNTCSSEPSPHPDFRFLHRPSTSQARDLQDIPGTMFSTQSLVSHAVSSQDNLYPMALRLGNPYGAGYAQNVSPGMVRPDLKNSLSNNGSTSCEPYHGAFEDYDETFSTRRVDSHAGLVHPTPKNAHMAANNLSFLSITEETSSLCPFKVPNEQPSCYITNNQPVYVPSITSYHTDKADLNFHAHKLHINPHTSQSTKFRSSENGAPWSSWSSWSMNTEADMWYNHRVTSDAADDMTWSTASPYDGPLPVNHPYIHAKQNTDSGILNHGLPIPPFGHIPMAGTPSSSVHESFVSSSAPKPTTIQTHQNQQLFPNNGYASSSKTVYSDTHAGSFNQHPLSESSPSYVHSTTEESTSPQPTNEDQAAIEASLHYSDARNAFLIDCKRRGLSYKDIKRMGGFKEAESTLRGRFRTLTKAKDQRVRKPKWQDKDVCEMTRSRI
jgi:hypothetical protein